MLNNRPGQSIPEETRQRVLEAARNLNYRPHASARALAAGRSDIVLLSIPDIPIGAGISRFIEGLAGALAAHKLTLVTHLAGAHGRPLPDVCAAVGASAVVGFESFDPATIKELHRAGAEVVLPSHAEHSYAMHPIGQIQAKHLIERGHQRLGYALTAHPGLASMARDRLGGVIEACAEAGLPAPLALATSLDADVAADAVARWSAEGVTAICAFNDETATAILAGMRAHGLTSPQDLAVIGVDDIPTARLADPPLTTIIFDMDQVVTRRAEAVLAGLAKTTDQSDQAWIDPQIVVRSST
ncbi:LacI family DNA-binding transcriptional regulator [Actinocorallia longicatena]|uniref:LacI family DNA-binding transcriptional regulator n=1 Tax=Actinocorallia longicatena TaxID=111803 RepID=A0ABP6QDF8_9ACTN